MQIRARKVVNQIFLPYAQARFTFAHRALCAAAILFRAAADIVRRLCYSLPPVQSFEFNAYMLHFRVHLILFHSLLVHAPHVDSISRLRVFVYLS